MDQALEGHALNPLESFYRAAGAAPPIVSPIDGAAMPDPYRGLLVHEQDMTSKLEAHLGQSISLRVLETRHEEAALCREVVLVGDVDGAPAEFGAIRILVDRLPEPARALVREGWRPLGGILREHRIRHRCQPKTFFEVPSDDLMRRVLGMSHAGSLFGRHNLLYACREDDDDVLLAEVIEILPSFPES